MKTKIKEIGYSKTIITMITVSIIYNCIIAIALCYLALVKNWWAALILIPICTLSPSFKTKESSLDEIKENTERENDNNEKFILSK